MTTIRGIEVKNNMKYEIEAFLKIINTKDEEEYNRLKEISYTVLSITEEARRQNNIIFKGEIVND